MAKLISDEATSKEKFQSVQLQTVQNNGGMRLALNTFSELEKFSAFMAVSNFVPKHLRNKQADCLAVLLQSMRWEMDPFTVAQKTYFVNELMGYEAQLVNAIIISRAPIKQRPKFIWIGEGESLKCKVSATFKDEDEPSEFEAELKTITTRNSPLWKQQPKQQLSYFALRAWARIYAPDIIMGVYTKEEVESISMHVGAENALNITPKSSPQTSAINEILQKSSQQPFDPSTGEIIPDALPPKTDHLNASIDAAMASQGDLLSDKVWIKARSILENEDVAEDATTEISLRDRVNNMLALMSMDDKITESDDFKVLWKDLKASHDKELIGLISAAVA